ncbi:MAG: hypothetical protein HN350_15935, partial [Phycisphaerales bacterium]|nr:hypothetical protein [Phycisphaerales bacterium]
MFEHQRPLPTTGDGEDALPAGPVSPPARSRIRRPVLVPLAIAILALVGTITFLLRHDAQARISAESAEAFDRVSEVFETTLAEDASLLGAALEALDGDESLRSAFIARDTDALLT